LIRLNTDTRYYQADAFVFAERRAAEVEAEHPDLPQLVIGTGGGQALMGGVAADTLAGGAGAQSLDGAAGADRLLGGVGRDLLLGGDGADLLRGGGGADTLAGGAGADTLAGGAGADVFRFAAVSDSPPADPDVIRDFTPGEDRIDFSEFGLGGGLAWLGGAAFTAAGHAEARLRLQGTDRTLLLLDLDGDGEAELAILFRGAAPGAADLML